MFLDGVLKRRYIRARPTPPLNTSVCRATRKPYHFRINTSVRRAAARRATLNEAISLWRLLARVAKFTSCHSHSLTAPFVPSRAFDLPSPPVIDFGVEQKKRWGSNAVPLSSSPNLRVGSAALPTPPTKNRVRAILGRGRFECARA